MTEQLKQHLISEIENLGFKIEENLIYKLEDVAINNNLSLPNLLDELSSFIFSKKLDLNKPIKADSLDQFANSFVLRRSSMSGTPKLNKSLPTPIFNSKTLRQSIHANNATKSWLVDDLDDDVANIYGVTPDKKVSFSTPIVKPSVDGAEFNTYITPTRPAKNENVFSTPLAGDNTSIMCVWGDLNTMPNLNISGSLGDCGQCTIKKHELHSSSEYCMFQKLTDIVYYLEDNLESMTKNIQEKLENIKKFHNIGVISLSEVYVCGRISFMSPLNHLKIGNVILEGSLSTCSGAKIILDVSNIPSCSLFSGQIVVAKGIHPTPSAFVANQLFYETNYVPQEASAKSNILKGIVIAGPYLPKDTFDSSFISKIVNIVLTKSPSLLILIGPFLEYDDKKIDSMDITCSDFMAEFYNTLKGVQDKYNVKIVVIPSLQDITSLPLYPQFPLSGVPAAINSFPNPCLFSCDNFVIAVSTLDICMHMSASECSKGEQSVDRISRIIKHILDQKSFYPLYPPHPDSLIDYKRLIDYGKIHVEPDVLILPSNLRPFIKKVGKTLCINPYRFFKNENDSYISSFQLQKNELNVIDEKHSFAQIVKL